MIVKNHEGKTLGSVLHGLVYAHVSPKCGKRLGYARCRIQVRGLEFEVGSKFLLRQLTGLLIRQKHQAC
jgi:hypothetical protein